LAIDAVQKADSGRAHGFSAGGLYPVAGVSAI
jgi:hypothetical protein